LSQPSDNLGAWVVAWAVIAVLIMVTRMRTQAAGAGLVAAFLISFAMDHWLGAAIYLTPEYTRSDPNVVAIGFQLATLGVAAFGIGSVLLAPGLMRVLPRPGRGNNPTPVGQQPATTIIVFGLLLLLVLLPLARKVPTLTAILSQGLSVVVVGLGLACWNAWHTRRAGAFALWLLGTLCLPFLTIVTVGFLGYGSVAAMAIMTFLARFVRPRWTTVLVGLAMTYLGLSLFVTYMRDRPALRESQATQGIPDRIARTYETMTSFEFFDLSNQTHLNRIDDRLNQNVLVGRAVVFLDQGLTPYAQFDTLWNGVLALVPRAIWPTKPVSAGSPQLVSRFTGLTFAPGTSVGIGNVMEAYVSFGTPGVALAFLLIGALVGLLDTAAGSRLRAGNWGGFLLWYLPALSFLQGPTGSLVEITSTAAAGLVVAFLLTRLVKPRPTATVAPTPRTVARRRPVFTRA
jgi:hypothetical protein